MGAPRAVALCFNFRGALNFQSGYWSDAETGLRDAVDIYRQVGSAAGEALSLQRLGVLLTAKGELDEAQECLNSGLVVAERAAMRSHCLTRLHASLIRNRLAADDKEGLDLSLAEGLEVAKRHGDCVTCNALLLPEVAAAEIKRGNIDAADKAAQQLAKTAEEFDSRSWAAMAAQARGRVALAQGNTEEATTLFDNAFTAFNEVGQPYDAARCRRLQAESRRAAGGKGSKKEADELAAEAQSMFDDIGAPGLEA